MAGQERRALGGFGAVAILDNATLYATARAAIADLHFVLATTARERGQMKRVFGPESALREIYARAAAGEAVGVLFGRERTGLENDEVALANAVITFPVDPTFSSLNLAQAVLLLAYEWFKAADGGLPFTGEARSPPATRDSILSFFDYLEAELEAVNVLSAGQKARDGAQHARHAPPDGDVRAGRAYLAWRGARHRRRPTVEKDRMTACIHPTFRLDASEHFPAKRTRFAIENAADKS